MNTRVVGMPSPGFFWNGARLGQAPPVPGISPSSESVADLSTPVSAAQWEALPWTQNDAKAAFGVANLLWTVREKIAFSAVTFQAMVADPSLLGTIQKLPDGAAFFGATNVLIGLSKQLSLPNLMSSVRNLLIALETRVFPQNFSIGVQGRRPVFRGPNWPTPNILDYVDVKPQAGLKDILDFGDLSKTHLAGDVAALRAAADGASGIQAPVLAFIVKFASWVAGALLDAQVASYPPLSRIAQAVNPILSSPDLEKAVQAKDPQKAQPILANLKESRKIWASGGSKAVIWVAIGAGAIALGFLGSWILSPSKK
jgi:hypothetical protein